MFSTPLCKISTFHKGKKYPRVSKNTGYYPNFVDERGIDQDITSFFNRMFASRELASELSSKTNAFSSTFLS